MVGQGFLGPGQTGPDRAASFLAAVGPGFFGLSQAGPGVTIANLGQARSNKTGLCHTLTANPADHALHETKLLTTLIVSCQASPSRCWDQHSYSRHTKWYYVATTTRHKTDSINNIRYRQLRIDVVVMLAAKKTQPYTQVLHEFLPGWCSNVENVVTARGEENSRWVKFL